MECAHLLARVPFCEAPPSPVSDLFLFAFSQTLFSALRPSSLLLKRDRETDRQTERQTDRQRERERERELLCIYLLTSTKVLALLVQKYQY